MNTKTNLSTRLEQYESTTLGEAVRNHSVSEIAGFVAAAGAGLAMAGAADAAIIYSGVQNISVSINPAQQATSSSFLTMNSISIDIDGGGADVGLLAFFLASYNTTNATAKYLGGAFLSATGGATFQGAGGGTMNASNLAASNNISSGGSFNTNNAGQLRATNGTGGRLWGNFTLGNTGFVGIKLDSGNFGWIRLRVDELGLNQPLSTMLGGSIGDGLNYADQITVIDWAYETSGGAIHVGDTGSVSVPEPTPLALLAAGAIGIGAFRRRKAVIQAS